MEIGQQGLGDVVAGFEIRVVDFLVVLHVDDIMSDERTIGNLAVKQALELQHRLGEGSPPSIVDIRVGTVNVTTEPIDDEIGVAAGGATNNLRLDAVVQDLMSITPLSRDRPIAEVAIARFVSVA
jgi:hypothetical protein